MFSTSDWRLRSNLTQEQQHAAADGHQALVITDSLVFPQRWNTPLIGIPWPMEAAPGWLLSGSSGISQL